MGWLRRHWWYLTLPRETGAAPPSPSFDLPDDEQRRVCEALRRFDTADKAARDRAWSELPIGRLKLPFLREAFPTTTRMEARVTMVFDATFFARVSEDAFQLGVLGCRDRSKNVRDRACGVLAYSLRVDALPVLRSLLRAADDVTRESAEAAIDAIKQQNHHLYWDRDGPRGQTLWIVNRGDDPDRPESGRDIEGV